MTRYPNRFEQEERASKNQQRTQDALAELRRQEYLKKQQRDLEGAKELVEEYRASTPAPPANPYVIGHTPPAVDSRLGSARRARVPMEPLPPLTNDLGSAPQDGDYIGASPHRARPRPKKPRGEGA